MKHINHIFWDLDHTLWDFDRNSDLTFLKILNENTIKVDVSSFLKTYHPINRKFWELYRLNKVSKSHLRFYRLSDTFKKLGVEVSDELVNKLSENAFDKCCKYFEEEYVCNLFVNEIEKNI